MAALHTPITRDIEFLQHKDGTWYFRISQHGQEIFLSDPYTDREECHEVGMYLMDQSHDKDPLINEDHPTWEGK